MYQILREPSVIANKEQVLAILLMRFNIQPSKANFLATEWLSQHPGQNWETLKYLLNQNIVTVSKGVLRMVTESKGVLRDVHESTNPEDHTTKYRGITYSVLPEASQQLKPNPSAPKRRYRGVEY